MKNIHKLYLALIALSLFTACDKEEGLDQAIYIDAYLMIYADVGDQSIPFDGAQPLEEFDVYFYDSKEDYLFDENPILVVQDFSGGGINNEILNQMVWMRVRKDNLLNDRNTGLATYSPADSIPLCPCGGDGRRVGYVFLSSPRTNLQIQVVNEGEPVSGASVLLYWSENDYINEISPVSRIRSGENVSYPAGASLGNTFVVEATSVVGIANFDNLEDREYWIRVIKDDLNNDETTVKTRGVLAANDVSNILQIGIN